MSVETELEGDLNEFYKDARQDISKLLDGAAINSAVIFNASRAKVTFHVYNYVDTVNWVAAMKASVASGNSGTVAASGKFFKVHPNNNHNEEFLVAPGHAYVYRGPGALEKVA